MSDVLSFVVAIGAGLPPALAGGSRRGNHCFEPASAGLPERWRFEQIGQAFVVRTKPAKAGFKKWF